MNIRKEYDYSALFAEIDQVIHEDLSQMEQYCELGRFICACSEKGAAVAAAAYLAEKYPDQAGFSARNMRRMRDFYRMYKNDSELMTQAMRLGWTQNVVILEADLTAEERAWYLRAAEQFGWSKLTLQKKIAESAHLTEVLDFTSETFYNVRRTLHQSQSPRSGDFKLRMQFGKTQSGLLLCYTEQDEAATMSFAQKDTGRHLFRIVYKDDTLPYEVVFELPSEDDFELPDERKWDAAEQTLRSFTKSSPVILTMQYDYGDGWEVTLRLEEIIEDKELPGKELPRVLEGEGYGIIEDCGGSQGLAHLGEVFERKSGAEYKELSDWLGQEDLNLSSFDLDDMNFRLKKLPRIFTDIYEHGLEPTQQSIDLLERRYKRK